MIVSRLNNGSTSKTKAGRFIFGNTNRGTTIGTSTRNGEKYLPELKRRPTEHGDEDGQ
jgi:hypothetical protein